jgi:membrane protein implicated in regulation of membrane protease activity
MFIVFAAAVLIVTGAVAALALVGTWWMLGLMFAVDLTMTTTVIVTIAFVLDGRAQRIATRGRRSPVHGPPEGDRPQARIRPLTAA